MRCLAIRLPETASAAISSPVAVPSGTIAMRTSSKQLLVPSVPSVPSCFRVTRYCANDKEYFEDKRVLIFLQGQSVGGRGRLWTASNR